MGRRRKSGPRHPNGELVHGPDRGTPELQVYRAMLVGDPRDPRASYPLGILWARGKILEADHRAGLTYAALRVLAIGMARDRIPSHLAIIVTGLGSRSSPAPDDPKTWRIKYERQFGAVRQVLRQRGSRVLHVTDNIALYERPLRFMDSARSRSPSAWLADERDVEALEDGLAALCGYFQFDRDARR